MLNMTVSHKTRDTRRLYAWEARTFRGRPCVSIATLRRLAQRVWRDLKINRPLPQIVAGRGTPYNGRLYSYYDGVKIVLARNERQVHVLLHELTHAMGYDDHDQRFVKQYLMLLNRYVSATLQFEV